MRRIILVTWSIIVVVSSVMLAYSTIYEIDSYQTVMCMRFQVLDVSISRNSSGHFDNFRLTGDFSNPSWFSSVRLKSIENVVVLNGEGSEYLRKVHWLIITIPAQSHRTIILTYDILPQFVEIFSEANSSNNWNWSFTITVNLESSLLESGQYDRSQEFTGVTINPPSLPIF